MTQLQDASAFLSKQVKEDTLQIWHELLGSQAGPVEYACQRRNSLFRGAEAIKCWSTEFDSGGDTHKMKPFFN